MTGLKQFKKIGFSKKWEPSGQVPRVFIKLNGCSLGVKDELHAQLFMEEFERLCDKYSKGRWAMSAEVGIYNQNSEPLDGTIEHKEAGKNDFEIKIDGLDGSDVPKDNNS